METRTPLGQPHGPRAPDDPWIAVVARIAQGDEAALRRLYDEFAPRVLGVATQVLRDRDVAEEAVVDVFGQVWRQASRYEPLKGSVAAWVCTLARTRAIDLRRSRARHAKRESELVAEQSDYFCGAEPTPYDAAADGDRAEHVRRALATLTHEQRRAVEAAFFGGLSHTEIAEAFGQPLGTVKTRIRSGMAALRTALATVEGEVA